MKFNEDINLTDQEKRVFLKALLKLIIADGKIENAEAAIIKKIGKAYQLSPEQLDRAKAEFKSEITDAELAAIASRHKQLELVKAMCMVASIDNHLADDELDFIIDIADRMNVAHSKILEINEIVQNILLLEAKNKVVMEL